MKEYQLQPFLIKNNAINQFLNWRVICYILLFAVLALPVSYLTTIKYRSEILFLVIRLIQVNNFVFLGMLHSEFLVKKSLFSHYTAKEKFYFTIVLSLFIYFFLLLFYFALNSDMQRMAIVSTCSFFLPYMFVQAWNYFLLLPGNKSMIWNDYKPFAVKADIAYLNSILIQFKLSKRFEVKEEALFPINIPLNIELGQLFNSFLNLENKDGNTNIEYLAHNNKPFAWKFYVVTFGGMYQKVLDPEKTLQNNGDIKRNTTILAKRIEIL